MMDPFQRIREEAYEANRQLPGLGLVKFTFGNASAADHTQRVFAIKPSGVLYEKLSPDKMVVVSFDGQVVSGHLRPSSDTLTHAVLYSHWPDIGGIVHTHSTYATAWAQALRDIPIYGTTHADHLPVDVPCAPPMADDMIQGNYEYQTGMQIIQYFQEHGLDYHQIPMILVGSHAPFTWGTTVEKAVYHSAILEEMAFMAYLTEQIHGRVNPSTLPPRLKPALIEKHYERKHGSQAHYGQDTND
ncbi:L-ribulose 5-phosphate 4-epimerase [Thermoflavifilum aggregans]|uniref:L-ribulose-5-phosphate 4-epimerase n=1 Tax=Thermoflavifilum aggregans TaxID=454188 RepID=A0A2M9CWY7_9BACT|nr:L-ribulose-5-phosphate 4-epimerase AraD [Thermoflavifilum aggregans]PJJ76400.1 L-ribulose 5-phosphate 4-epimerase [Thermoflavifilum aggregans]